MNKFNMVLAAAALIFFAGGAQARVQEPLYTCSLAFDVAGGGLKVFIGSYTLRGEGTVTCVDIAGNAEVIPVRVMVGAQPVSLSAGIGVMRMVGLASGIGLAGSPYDLMGNYLVGGVHGSLVVGGGAQVALHAADRALTLNAAIQAVSGLGANVGLDYLTIEPL